MKDFRIYIRDREHSEAVQNYFFSQGIYWVGEKKRPILVQRGYLLVIRYGDCVTPKLAFREQMTEQYKALVPERWFYNNRINRVPPAEDEAGKTDAKAEISALENSDTDEWYGGRPIETVRDFLLALAEGKHIEIYCEERNRWQKVTNLFPDSMFSAPGEINLAHKLTRPTRVAYQYRYCNGMKIDCCVTHAPTLGTVYFTPSVRATDKYDVMSWMGSEEDFRLLRKGLVYDTEASAQIHHDAMIITERKDS